MALEAERIYPNCPTVIRIVPIGGVTKGELLAQATQRHLAERGGRAVIRQPSFHDR